MTGKLRISSIILTTCLLLGNASAQRPATGSFPDHFCTGKELFDAGNYRAAQAELTKALGDTGPDRKQETASAEYMLAMCAAKLGEPGAKDLLTAYISKYPGSGHVNEIRFAMANQYFDAGDYANALAEYEPMIQYLNTFSRAERNEYHFKYAYSTFMLSDRLGSDAVRGAYHDFMQVGQGEYYVHALYYIAYIDYSDGNLAAAKRGFSELQHAGVSGRNPYADVIPFYLLQIEFSEGNYDYVIANGEPLMRSAAGPRATEIARILAESWFYKDDYARTLQYMDIYRNGGGGMGRSENYLVGYSQYVRNDIGQAMVSLEKVAGPDDKLTQNAAYHLADMYLKAGDKRRAMQAFSMAAGADYDASIREDALFNYGKLQFEMGGGVFNEAINILGRYISEYPRSPRIDEAREYLASAYYNSRNYEAAYDAIRQMPNPDNNVRTAYQKIAYFRALEYYQAGDPDRAMAMLQESLINKYNPKYTALTSFWMGEIEFGRGNYERAATRYREYLNVAPQTEDEYKMAWYGLGYSNFNRQRWDDSKNAFDRFIAQRPGRNSYLADAFNRLGDISFAQREYWRAIENYDKAVEIGTDERFYAQFQRAIMLGFVDRHDRKIESLNQIAATEEGPYADDALFELGRTHLGARQYNDAARVMKLFVNKYPASAHYPAALSDLGLIYQNLDDNATALKYYQTVVEKAPGSPEARDASLAIKNIYVDMNNVDAYFAYAQRSGIETDMGAVARDSLAYAAAEKVYLEGTSAARKTEALKSYIDRYPRGYYRPNALYYLADAYVLAGNRQAAITSLEELSKLGHNSFTVRGLEKLAPMLSQERRYGESAAAYRQLSSSAVNPQTISMALSAYLENAVLAGDEHLLDAAANHVYGSPASTASAKREARYEMAGITERGGNLNEAANIYRELAIESQTLVGAKATVKAIESYYREGRLQQAEDMIIRFAGENSPHTYQLGEAFLILGDIYADKGDNFQARATLQSIVDGYSPADDGIVEAARQRIENLK